MIEHYRDSTAQYYRVGAPATGRLISQNNQTPAFIRQLVMEKHRAKLARNNEDTH